MLKQRNTSLMPEAMADKQRRIRRHRQKRRRDNLGEVIERGELFGPNLLSDACIAAISLPISDKERIRQHDALATLSGPVAALPWASDPAKFVIGAEWRSDHGAYSPDPNRAISSGSTSTSVSGGYNSYDIRRSGLRGMAVDVRTHGTPFGGGEGLRT